MSLSVSASQAGRYKSVFPFSCHLFFPPRALPWEKELFLRSWEKSSYFGRTRHCFELQPRKLSLLSISSLSGLVAQCLPSVQSRVLCRSCFCCAEQHARSRRRHDGFCKSCTTCGAAARGCAVTSLLLCVSLVDGGREPEPRVSVSHQIMNEKPRTHAWKTNCLHS